MLHVLSCSCLCPIHWSQVLGREWRCCWSSADRRCSNYIWLINNFIAYWGATCIRSFMSAWTLTVKLISGECHRSSLMRSQHWLRLWLGVVRQQAITWANVDPDLCHHMASLGLNELIQIFLDKWYVVIGLFSINEAFFFPTTFFFFFPSFFSPHFFPTSSFIFLFSLPHFSFSPTSFFSYLIFLFPNLIFLLFFPA